jgi:predicted transglutaminase-like cysteine proteinase
VGEITRAPVGWVEFCQDVPADCAPDSAAAETLPGSRSWRELAQVNKMVNETIKPMTDLEHHGVIEKWSYPDDGYGDCEDYVLLKRRMLMEIGWPRGALLVTVVRDQKGEGHAVLTVSTDKGDFVLDNQISNIRPWSETPYRYVKRQSQNDPNVWVSLGDPRPAVATATSR